MASGSSSWLTERRATTISKQSGRVEQNGNGVVLEFDIERAIRAYRHIAELWRRRLDSPTEVFPQFEPPERKFAPAAFRPGGCLYGTRHHALFLFWAGWLNRNGKTAAEVIRKLGALWDERRYEHIFDPISAKDRPAEDFEPIRPLIVFADLPKYACRVDWWIEGLAILRERYNGDPRNILLQGLSHDPWEDRKDIIRRFKEFKGVAHKIAQLMAVWMQEVEWPDHEKEWSYVKTLPFIAVDMWAARMIRQWGIVTAWSSDHSQTVMEKISEFISKVCLTSRIPPTDLIQGIWHIGSIVCGKRRPRDMNKAVEFCAHCPAAKFCIGMVPANIEAIYEGIGSGQIGRRTQRTSSMRWDDMIPRPEPEREDPRLFHKNPTHLLGQDP